MRHVIIGSSAAGLKAAETLRQYAPESAVTLISDEAQRPYSRPLLTYLLSREVSEDRLWLRGKIFLTSGASRPAWASGWSGWTRRPMRCGSPPGRAWVRPPAPRLRGPAAPAGDSRRGPGGGLHPAHPGRLAAPGPGLPAGGPVAVVGAGAVGLKAADAVTRRGHRVTLLEAESHALPRLLEAEAARLLHRALEEIGVELHFNCSPLAILGDQGRVRALALSDGREIPAAAVLLAVGVTPNLDFLEGTGLTDACGLTVNAAMQTGQPDIFAAGDCTRAPHFLTGQPAYYPIWPAAVAGGRVAAVNMAGGEVSFPGLLPQNSISLRGFHLITGGLGPDECEDCEIVSQFDQTRGHYRRLAYREGRLVGLTFVGAIEDAGIHFQLLARQEQVKGRLTRDRCGVIRALHSVAQNTGQSATGQKYPEHGIG